MKGMGEGYLFAEPHRRSVLALQKPFGKSFIRKSLSGKRPAHSSQDVVVGRFRFENENSRVVQQRKQNRVAAVGDRDVQLVDVAHLVDPLPEDLFVEDLVQIDYRDAFDAASSVCRDKQIVLMHIVETSGPVRNNVEDRVLFEYMPQLVGDDVAALTAAGSCSAGASI